MNLEIIYSKIGGGLQRGLIAPPPPSPPPNPPAAKFTSQGHAHLRTNTQIKFLYYPLTLIFKYNSIESKCTILIIFPYSCFSGFFWNGNAWGDSGEWPSGLRCCSMNRKVPVQTPLRARPGLGTQPHYEAPSDLRVKNVKHSD